jgi:hypothetical protein
VSQEARPTVFRTLHSAHCVSGGEGVFGGLCGVGGGEGTRRDFRLHACCAFLDAQKWV